MIGGRWVLNLMARNRTGDNVKVVQHEVWRSGATAQLDLPFSLHCCPALITGEK
jgi:hypothetical protein